MTPSFSGNLSANYTTPLFGGRAFASATLSHTSSYYVSGGNRLKMPAYSLLNGSIGWRADGGAEIRLWAKNLTNENYFQYRIEQSLVGAGQVQDRKNDVSGKSVAVRVVFGVRRYIKKTTK